MHYIPRMPPIEISADWTNKLATALKPWGVVDARTTPDGELPVMLTLYMSGNIYQTLDLQERLDRFFAELEFPDAKSQRAGLKRSEAKAYRDACNKIVTPHPFYLLALYLEQSPEKFAKRFPPTMTFAWQEGKGYWTHRFYPTADSAPATKKQDIDAMAGIEGLEAFLKAHKLHRPGCWLDAFPAYAEIGLSFNDSRDATRLHKGTYDLVHSLQAAGETFNFPLLSRHPESDKPMVRISIPLLERLVSLAATNPEQLREAFPTPAAKVMAKT